MKKLGLQRISNQSNSAVPGEVASWSNGVKFLTRQSSVHDRRPRFWYYVALPPVDARGLNAIFFTEAIFDDNDDDDDRVQYLEAVTALGIACSTKRISDELSTD